jgi:heat shock protein HslJ
VTEALAGHWVVERLTNPDGLLDPLISGTRIEILFQPDAAVAGSAGCNSFRGSYRTDGRSITFDTPATTRRFCHRPPGVMEQESRFLESISATTGYSIGEDGTLSLVDADGLSLAVMTRSPST